MIQVIIIASLVGAGILIAIALLFDESGRSR